MKRVLLSIVVCVMLVLGANIALAIPMLYTYDFTANGFSELLYPYNHVPSNTSLTGTVKIILDKYNYTPAGMVDYISLTIGDHVYTSDEVLYNRRLDGYITIGGSVNGIGRIIPTPGLPDFFLCGYISGYGPTVNNRFDYNVGDTPTFATRDMTIRETITNVPATPVPEPSTLVLVTCGIAGLAVLKRKSRG